MSKMPKLRNKTLKRTVIAAIHANAGVTDWYAVKLQEVLLDAINDAVMMLTPVFQARLPVGVVAFASDWCEGRLVPRIAADAAPTITKIDRALKKWGDKWQSKFDKLSRDVSKRFATRSFTATDVALKAALKKAGFTVSFKASKRSLESYKLVVADNVGLIRNLQQALYNKIQQDTWASVRAGGDMAALSQKLHKSYGIEANRAALIAKDQNNKAKATLETTRRQELGLKQAIWQHSGGGKTKRPVHVKWGRDGQIFDIDKGLYDPDEGQWVLPGVLINCGCTSRAVIPGFDD
jgi:hypothetical protein